ncbi:hypothetical protein MTP99_015284 [Tenebrio molitor]|uniref:GILT-like protein 1 n=1 Tax=Tenebrio molitor TaxID=7067 RepID=UPI0026FE64DF|nr:hypothetical protein MTP99_015284 [Tenebrio molitor]
MRVQWTVWLSFLYITAAKAEKLEVAVYYESLCPASIEFITTQLDPSFKKVEKYLDLDLVTFGKATADNSSGHWKFTCQHGPLECYGNKIYSCVIKHNSTASSLEFVNCGMNSNLNNNSLQICAAKTGIPWEIIHWCLSSGEADYLLAKNGYKTKSVTPPIRFVPTIIFNGVYNESEDQEARENFFKVVCQLLKNKPPICKQLGILFNILM